MHEHGKKILGVTGTSHSPEHEMNMEVGKHHEELGKHEKRALEGKKHHHDSSY